MCSPFGTLHKTIVKSMDPDAKYSPFGENSTVFTKEESVVRVLRCYPLDTFHKIIVLS